MTLQNLAQLVGTTAQTIQRLETNNMTVSLDWLERIADAFGVPVTELLVDSRSQKISLLGEIDATGELRPSPGATSGYDLSLAIPAEFPVAARVSSDLGGFVAGTLLIGGKIAIDATTRLAQRDCLVALNSGRMMLCKVTIDDRGVELHGSNCFSDDADANVDWVAPVVMAVRYL